MSGNGIDLAAVYQLLVQVAEAVRVQSTVLHDLSETVNGHTTILNGHTAVLNNHTTVLNNHTTVLNDHTTVLNNHTEVLKDHSRVLGDHTRVLNEHTLLFHDHGRKLDDLEHGQTSLRQTVTQYHSSVMGHGILISELEHRVRRIEDHLHLPPVA